MRVKNVRKTRENLHEVVEEFISFKTAQKLRERTTAEYRKYLGNFIRAVRDMNLEISGIRMEAVAVLRGGASAFTATIKAKRRVDHAGILAQINKRDGIDYLEEI